MTDKYERMRQKVNAWVADAGHGYVSLEGVFSLEDLQGVVKMMGQANEITTSEIVCPDCGSAACYCGMNRTD